MKKLSFIVFAICLISASCSNDENSQEEDSKKLEKMYNEIIVASLANSEPCTNPAEWSFTPIGSKSCGGPNSHIVYSKKINTAAFLDKVKAYTDAETAFNEKWKIASVCDMIIMPNGVECAEGKPKLTHTPGAY